MVLQPLRPDIFGLHAPNRLVCTTRLPDQTKPYNAHTQYRSHHALRSQSRDKTRCRPYHPVPTRITTTLIMAYQLLGIYPSSQRSQTPF